MMDVAGGGGGGSGTGSGSTSAHRVSRSGSVTSAPGTPNSKTQPGYLAENWHMLTTALEQAARNRDALLTSRSSSSSIGGDGSSPSLSRSNSNGSQQQAKGRERATSFSSDSEQERLSEEQRIKSPQHQVFAKKRLSHYDEYQRLQEWRRTHPDEDEDEDEEDGEEGGKDGGGGSSTAMQGTK